jgi:hypothetical protein
VTAGTVTGAVGTINILGKNASSIEVGTTASVANLPAGTYTLTVLMIALLNQLVTVGQPATALALAASTKSDVLF